MLHSCNDIGSLRDWCADPEAKVRIDEFRGPPNIDVLLTGCDDNGPVVAAVEAKADETCCIGDQPNIRQTFAGA